MASFCYFENFLFKGVEIYMVNAELQHNPYLLETEVKFNGQEPKINSQIEKFENKLLADWVRDVPRMFYDEMNGYDFDLFFSGTEYDFQKLQQTFISLGVTPAMLGGQIGGQAGGQISSFISSLAPAKQISKSKTTGVTTTEENKAVTDMLFMLDEALKKMNEYDSYGLWNVAGYFLSDDMSASEIAASNYRSLMNGDNYGREVSAINSWRSKDQGIVGEYRDLTTYLSRFVHPMFNYGGNLIVTPSTNISGKELGLHLGLPRSTVPGLPVIEHAEFGKEVNTYQLFEKETSNRPEDRITLGRVFDMGLITDKIVELNNKSLNMHTFITGSTGSGKSNTVYQILMELRQDRVPFLVIEPAKGEYKDVFGHLPDVNVFSTNPGIAQLININPFKFPRSIHVLPFCRSWLKSCLVSQTLSLRILLLPEIRMNSGH